MTLTCNVSGVPPPIVSWMKPNGDRRVGYLLEVTNINRSEAGEYKCEASNECGNATERAAIDVQCKCMRIFSSKVYVNRFTGGSFCYMYDIHVYNLYKSE